MKSWHWGILAVVFVGTVIAAFFDPAGATPPVFYAVFGFFGCLLLLFLTKVAGKKFLARKEDYYDAP